LPQAYDLEGRGFESAKCVFLLHASIYSRRSFWRRRGGTARGGHRGADRGGQHGHDRGGALSLRGRFWRCV